jgi:hypothetical protein
MKSGRTMGCNYYSLFLKLRLPPLKVKLTFADLSVTKHKDSIALYDSGLWNRLQFLTSVCSHKICVMYVYAIRLIL